MSKAETWRAAARQQNAADLSRQVEWMDLLAESAATMAESMARLSEETRETLSELKSAAENVKEETSQAGSAHRTALHELTATTQEIRSVLSTWQSQLETAVNESERRIKGSLRGITIKLWLAVILSAILSGALSGWLIWQWSSRHPDETRNAYRAGMKAAIEEMSRNYTITRRTSPRKQSKPSPAPTGLNDSTSDSATSKPAE